MLLGAPVCTLCIPCFCAAPHSRLDCLEYLRHGATGLPLSEDNSRLSLQVRQWRSLAPLQHPRYNHGVAELNGLLYVVGGCNATGLLATVERYNHSEGK